MKGVLEILYSLLPTKPGPRISSPRITIDILYENSVGELVQLQMTKNLSAAFVEFFSIIDHGIEVPLPNETYTEKDFTIVTKEYGESNMLTYLLPFLQS